MSASERDDHLRNHGGLEQRRGLLAHALRYFASIVLLVGCGTPGPTVSVPVYSAPVDSSLGSLKTMAVAPFKNDQDNVFTHIVEAQLGNTSIVDKNLDNTRVIVVTSANQTRPEVVNAKTDADLATAGKRLKVGAVLAGEISDRRSESQNYKSSKDVCSQEKTFNSGTKKEYTSCVKFATVPIDCRRVTVSFKVAYRIVASDGAVLLRKQADIEDRDDECEGRRVQKPNATPATPSSWSDLLARQREEPMRTPGQMLQEVMAKAATEIRDSVIPAQKTISAQFLSDTDGIVDTALRDRFTGALKFAAASRVDRACETFREIFVKEKQSVALTFDVGLCDEIDGQLESALLKYQTADRMLKEPNKVISEALARLTKQVNVRDTIAAKRGDLLDPTAARRTGPNVRQNPIRIDSAGGPPKELKEVMKKETRVALVIGNGRYRELASLKNAVNDADDMAASLKTLGFNVIIGKELTHQQTLEILARFKKNLKKDDVALFYFSGHGVSYENSNFLLPVDFKPAWARQGKETVKSKALDIEEQIVKSLKESKTRVRIVIADACREVPQVEAASRSISRGLVPAKQPARGTLVSYAAGAGQTADDGPGKNGLFTSKLLEAMLIPNVPAGQVFKAVQESVAATTEDEQVPALYDELKGEFYFRVD